MISSVPTESHCRASWGLKSYSTESASVSLNDDRASGVSRAHCSQQMMITRKRQPSPSREAEQRPLKRPRYVSDSQPTLQELSVFSQASRESSGSTSYPIKAIVAERSNKFLVDWADDPITGEGFSPSWVSISLVDSLSMLYMLQSNIELGWNKTVIIS